MKKSIKKFCLLMIMGSLIWQTGATYALTNSEVPQQNEVNTTEMSIRFNQPYAIVGQPLSVYIEGADENNCTYSWMIDGQSISNTLGSYTPTQNDLEKIISVKVQSVDGKEAIREILVSEIPVVYINIENGAEVVDKENYLNAQMHIQGNSIWTEAQGAQFDGAIEIKGRGNSTWAEPKKPYKLKLKEKADLFGMGKSKHWVLLANYTDQSLLRNTLAYDLSGELGLPQMQTVWVDVVMNGKKIGNYQLCEQIRIDEDRINIFDWEDASADCAKAVAKKEGWDKDTRDALEDAMNENMSWITSNSFVFNNKTLVISDYYEVPEINGGFLMEMDEYYDEISKFKTSSDQPLMFKSPEFINTNNKMINYVQNYIQAFEDAVANHDTYSANYSGKEQHYSDLFDMNSLIDFWLVQELFFNEDAMKKSTYLYKNIDDTFHMGPIWDMDWAANGQGDTAHYDKWQTQYFSARAQSKQWYKDLIKDPYFVMKAQERYWEVRDLLTDIIKKDGKIDAYEDYLYASAIENCNRWYGANNTFTNNVQKLKTWMTNRVAWLDKQFYSQSSIFNSFSISQNMAMSALFKDEDGKLLAKNEADDNTALDAIIPYNEDVNVEVKDENATSMRATLNGRVIYEKKLQHNTSFKIPYASFADVKEKNILEISLFQDDSKISSRVFTLAKSNVFPESLSVKLPTKLEYEIGETFVSTGMSVELVMNDGTKLDINDYELSGFDSTTPGEKVITIKYQEFETNFKVLVKEIDTVDKTILQNLVDKVSDLVESDYTTVTWTLFKQQLNNAIEMLDASDVDQVGVNEQIDSLEKAQLALVKRGDKTSLQSAYDDALQLKENDYTSVTWSIFEEKRDSAKAVLDDIDATQSRINEIKQTLLDAQLALVKRADKTALLETYDNAIKLEEKMYTSDTWLVFHEALERAKSVLDNSGATQLRVNESNQALLKAQSALIKRGDKKDLRSIYEKASTLKESEYTSDSWSKFKVAYDESTIILGDLDATEKAVSDAHHKLQLAIDSLKAKNDDKTVTDKVETGDNHNKVIFIATMLGAGMIAFFALKKRKFTK